MAGCVEPGVLLEGGWWEGVGYKCLLIDLEEALAQVFPPCMHTYPIFCLPLHY